MKPAVLMFISLLSLSAALAQNYNSTVSYYPCKDGSWLVLEGASEVLMPRINLNTPDGNWNYPYDYYPVYSKNQIISGTFFGHNAIAGTIAEVAVLRLNTSSFQEALKELYNLEVMNKSEQTQFTSFYPNRTGAGHFSAHGQPSGLYALIIRDPNRSLVLSAIPILVTDDMISVESASKVDTSEPMNVKINILEGQMNISRKYGAAIVSLETYKSARINTTSNGSKGGMTSTIKIDNESLKIVGEPKISQGLVDQILQILPADCALALSESNSTKSEMELLHDGDWTPGQYVLTCGVYSNNGLGGITQKIIKIEDNKAENN